MFIRANGYKRNTRRLDYFKTQATGCPNSIARSLPPVHRNFSFEPALRLLRFTQETVPVHGRNFDLMTLGLPKSLNDSIHSMDFGTEYSGDRSTIPPPPTIGQGMAAAFLPGLHQRYLKGFSS